MLCKKCKTELPDNAVYCHFCGKRQVSLSQKTKSRGNGTGSVYKRGSTWTAAATVGIKVVNGKKKQIRATKGGFTTKKSALEYIPTLLGRSEGKAPKIKTLESYWELYKLGKYKKISANTQSAYRTAWNKLSVLHTRGITELTINDLQSCINDKATTFDPAKDMQSVLSHCYNLAMAEQTITVNLAKYITLPELNAKETLPFNELEINNLWTAYGGGDKDAGYALLMIYSGMMPGELLKVKKDMIDWDRQVIIGAGLKTEKRRNTPIVIADFIIPVLRDLCDFSNTDKLCYLTRYQYYAAFRQMLSRCGCRPELRPYSCRHTTATLSALNNTAQAVLLEIMRQKRITTTQRYIHIDVEKSLEAINTLKFKNDEEKQ